MIFTYNNYHIKYMQPSTPPKASDHNMPDSHTFTIYSRDEEDKEAKIAALTAKVKAL